MLLREWSAARYPGSTLIEQLRLGPTHGELNGRVVSPAMSRMLAVNNWYADGVIVLADQVLAIEAKMKASPAAVSQLQFYVQQMMGTAELRPFLNRPFQGVLVWAIDDPAVSAFARGKGLRVEVYTPTWIETWMELVGFRNRSSVPVKTPEVSS
jgi:hypothetical protein